jgi:chemotaxis protein MotA
MLVIIGALVVLGSVITGYVLEGGNLKVLFQLKEFLIIGGAAMGSLMIGTPMSILKAMLHQTQLSLGNKGGDDKAEYLDLLAMQYQLYRLVQQSGAMALETHFDDPAKSPILSRYPRFLNRHDAVDFLSDSAKVIMIGGINVHDLEALMDEDLHVHHEHAGKPAAALNKIGDALPGLGIVAAVLGVVITMQAIDGPPSEIGEKVGAALVGTFLGILLSYGFVQPLATKLEHQVSAEGQYLQCLKAGLLSTYKGLAPAIAVEFARRVLAAEVRPTFEETEQACRAPRQEAVAA